MNTKYRIIGKCQNMYMLTNDPDASLNSILKEAFIMTSSGRILTKMLPINYLLRIEDEFNWETVDEEYNPKIHNKSNIVKDGLLGLAIGDALGVPYEFMDKKKIEKLEIKDMVGSDTPHEGLGQWSSVIPSGSWSDDTSMTLATMTAMIEDKGEIIYTTMMNHYIDWLTKGKYTSLDKAFGLGNITYQAIKRYTKGVKPPQCGGTGIRDNGNGSLMRILPLSLYCIMNELTESETKNIISESSAITHGHDISKMSCFIYTEFLKYLLEKKDPDLALDEVKKIDYSLYFSKEAIKEHDKILKKDFKNKDFQEIVGSGYVVDTLECALYSILNTDSYEEAVKMAIKTGYDTDTIAAVTGSIAGIMYGYQSIPKNWIDKLKKKDDLVDIANKFYNLYQLPKIEEIGPIKK